MAVLLSMSTWVCTSFGKTFQNKEWRLTQSAEEKKQLEKQMLMRHS